VALDFKYHFGVVLPPFRKAASQPWDIEANPTGEVAALGHIVPYLWCRF
jgi:hypothetical protein